MSLKVYIILSLAACALGASMGGHEEDYAEPNYSFHYEVNDPKTKDIKSHREERMGDKTKGEYGLVEPDGSYRSVRYTVEGNSGFVADVKREKYDENKHGKYHPEEMGMPMEEEMKEMQVVMMEEPAMEMMEVRAEEPEAMIVMVMMEDGQLVPMKMVPLEAPKPKMMEETKRPIYQRIGAIVPQMEEAKMMEPAAKTYRYRY